MEASVRERKQKEYDERVNELVMIGYEQAMRGETEDFNAVCERLVKKYRDMVV